MASVMASTPVAGSVYNRISPLSSIVLPGGEAKRWWHWKSAAGAEGDALGLDTKRRQDGNDDSNAAGDERKRQAVVAAEIHGDAGLDRRVRRCQQISELVDEAGKGAAGLVWRQLIEMRGNHAPGALQSARTRL